MLHFAEIEQRINLAVVAKLSNAEADFGGGLIVPGIFDAVPILTYDVQSNNPQFQCLASAITSVNVGASVTINSVSYTVQNIEKGTAGMNLLDLTKT